MNSLIQRGLPMLIVSTLTACTTFDKSAKEHPITVFDGEWLGEMTQGRRHQYHAGWRAECLPDKASFHLSIQQGHIKMVFAGLDKESYISHAGRFELRRATNRKVQEKAYSAYLTDGAVTFILKGKLSANGAGNGALVKGIASLGNAGCTYPVQFSRKA